MRLTLQNLAHYLVDKGFLSPEYPVGGQYTATQTQSRNSIFQVKLGKKNSGLFVKQLQSLDANNGYLMQKEATAHYLIHQTELLKPLQPYVPEYYGYDPTIHVLVTQYFNDAQNLQDQVMTEKSLEKLAPKTLAKILALQHRDLSEQINQVASLQFFNRQPPWALLLGDPSHPTLQTSGFLTQPITQQILQQPNITATLEKLRIGWTSNHLIHGDIKLANFIALPSEQQQQPQLKLIDWEISDMGDALWDVAGLIQSIISSWVLTFDANTGFSKQYQGFEQFSDQAVRSFLSQFWSSYIEQRKQPNLNSQDNRTKLIEYTGARLLQTAIEANMQATTINPAASRIMQYCQSLFSEPEAMANLLLGEFAGGLTK